MRIRVLSSVLLPLLLAGCGTVLPGHIGGITTYVSPEDYAERLCEYVDLDAFPTCVSYVLDYFDQPHADVPPPGQSTAGPFAVVMDRVLYVGTYQSGLFSGSFRVAYGGKACRGSYSALRGSRDAIYDVYCDDGRAGWADLIRDQTGRSGIGQLTLNDGTEGKIVFGHIPLGEGPEFPYGDVWTRPAQTSGNGPRFGY